MIRRYTFKLYPSDAQAEALLSQARLSAQLWNALLEIRETFYRGERAKGAAKTSLSAFDMGKMITALRADPECREWAAQPRGTQERVAENLDLAFRAFFRRAMAGAGGQSGYPRYKSVARAAALPMREPLKSSWRLTPRVSPHEFASKGAGVSETGGERRQPKSWTFTLRGVGAMRARGEFPVSPSSFKTADIRFYAGAWWLSVAVEIERKRTRGNKNLRVTFDLIDQFASITEADGSCGAGPKAEFQPPEGEIPSIGEGLTVGSGAALANAGGEQANRCHCAAGSTGARLVDKIKSERDRRFKKFSSRWRCEVERAARHKSRDARRRREYLHRWSTWVVGQARELEIIAPPIRDNTRSGHGSSQRPGAEAATIAALNRHVLAQAPAAAIAMLVYKAIETGAPVAVLRDIDPPIRAGADLRAAAVANRRAKRLLRRKKEFAHV